MAFFVYKQSSLSFQVLLLLLVSSFHVFGSVAATFRDEGSSTRQKEANALLKWKGSLNNQSQHFLSSWVLGNGHCQWIGIICDKSRRVSQLNLSSSGLKGKLDDFSFSSFPKLSILDLMNNSLNGTIPSDIGNLSALTYLDLSSNSLSGNIPFEIGKLRSLSDLYLERHILTGKIPSSIGNLTDLFFLYLHKNMLSAAIPQQVGMLKSMSRLLLSDNNLVGPFPGSIGNLSNLFDLRLDNNKISGSIPNQIGMLASLEYLSLSNNIVLLVKFPLQ